MLIREFCAENLEHVPAALAAGAQRVELCDNLAAGGTTPSYGVIQAAVPLCHEAHAQVMCMIRPRGGDFEYSNAEAEIMCNDLAMAKSLGVNGVVFGCLKDGKVDKALTQELVKLAQARTAEAKHGINVTFHMAFDELDQKKQLEAIDWLASLGVERILTHGGPAGTPIEDNLSWLQTLVEHAQAAATPKNEPLIILPGGRMSWHNAEQVARALGVNEVHGTHIVKLA